MHEELFLKDAAPCPGCGRTDRLFFEDHSDWIYVTCGCGWSGPPDLGYSGAVEEWNKQRLRGEIAAIYARLWMDRPDDAMCMAKMLTTDEERDRALEELKEEE